MSSDYQVVHRTTDPVEADMLAELLSREGIPVRLLGTRSAALIGVASHIMRLRLEVPAEDAARAAELITALTHYPGSAEDGTRSDADTTSDDGTGDMPEASLSRDESELDDSDATPTPEAAEDGDLDEDDAAAPRRRRRLLAVGAGLVLPGGCHVYVRRAWTGIVLAATMISALVAMIAGHRDYHVLSSAAISYGFLLLADALGGQAELGAVNLGRTRSRFSQLVRGVMLAAIAVLLATLIGTNLKPPPPEPDPYLRELRRLQLQLQPRFPRGDEGRSQGDGGVVPFLLGDPLGWPPGARPPGSLPPTSQPLTGDDLRRDGPPLRGAGAGAGPPPARHPHADMGGWRGAKPSHSRATPPPGPVGSEPGRHRAGGPAEIGPARTSRPTATSAGQATRSRL